MCPMLPERLEPIGCEFGVTHSVLNVLVAEVMILQGPRILAVVDQLVAARMAQHVRIHRARARGELG